MKLKKSDLFYIGIGAGTMYSILDFLKWDTSILVQFLKVVCIVCCLMKVFFDSYKLKTLVLFLIVSIIALYTTVVTGEAYILIECLLVIAMKNIDAEKAIYSMYRVKQVILYICLSIFILNSIVASNSLEYMYVRNEIRYKIMFTHPNNAATFWLWHLVEYVYIHFDNLKKTHLFYVVGIGMLIWWLTKSDILLLSLLVLLLFVLVKSNTMIKLQKIISKYGFASTIGVCVLLLFFRNTKVYTILDMLTTGRLEMNVKAYEYYGFSLIGQNFISSSWVEHNGNVLGYMVLDNFYIRTIIQIGVFYILLLVIAFYLYAKYFSYKQMVCVAILIIYGMAEHYAGNIFIAFPLLLLGYYAMNHKKLEQIASKR